MNYQVIVEGQTIPVPEDIGSKDEDVKRALAPFYPEIANAMITRTVKDDVTTITVVKRAGTKGSGTGFATLIACPAGKNPAVALYEEIRGLGTEIDSFAALMLSERIEQALAEGEKQAEAVSYAVKRLAMSQAQPSPVVVAGF